MEKLNTINPPLHRYMNVLDGELRFSKCVNLVPGLKKIVQWLKILSLSHDFCIRMREISVILILVLSSCEGRRSSRITALDLSNQSLSAIPDSIFSLYNLEYLQLGNNVTLYPPLSALGRDSPDDSNLNRIHEVPAAIANLQKLRVLNISFNALHALPSEIVSLSALDTLDISFNKNLRIADEFNKLTMMPSLQYLNLIGTEVDSTVVQKLRRALPNTRIVASSTGFLPRS